MEERKSLRPQFVDVRFCQRGQSYGEKVTLEPCYSCPNCNRHFFSIKKDVKCCEYCGQLFDWSSPQKKMFEGKSKEELRSLFHDLCVAKQEGNRCESFVPYAEAYREQLHAGKELPLWEALDFVEKEFLLEATGRYFTELVL